MATPSPVLFNIATSKFDAMGGSGVTVMNAETIAISNTSAVTIVADSKSATASALQMTSTAAETEMVVSKFEGLPFGNYAITFRVKTSNNVIASNILKLQTYYRASETGSRILLKTCNIPATSFSSSGEYVNFTFITNYNGAYTDDRILEVAVSTLNSAGVTITLDYISAVLACAAQGAMGTV